MKWIDYREKLGIGFNDEQKFIMLKNKFFNIIDFLFKKNAYSLEDYDSYALMVGEPVLSTNPIIGLQLSMEKESDLVSFISKVIAVCNSYNVGAGKLQKKNFFGAFEHQLCLMNIPYEVIEDEDGYFIFPKGAKELDDALVSQPLEWLKAYPLSHKAFIKSLKDYASVTESNASDVADGFRKMLETFFQEFFSSQKTLENLKSEYGTFLKAHGVPQELANDFNTLLGAFTNYNNNYAKHHDKSSINVLEYLLYQTGNIIRLLITLNNGEKT